MRVSGVGERNLAFALSELDRDSSRLGIPRSVREDAAIIYRSAAKNKLIRGRSIEVVVASALYAACRRCNIPRTLDEIAIASNVSKKQVGKTYRFLSRELNIKLKPTSPSDYISRFASKLGLSGEVQAKAILEMKLRALSNLEHQKLVDELDRLSKLIDELKEIISSEDKRNQIIIEKLDYFVEIYGDERKTEILEGASDIDDEDLIPNENIVITMSNNGWFKRIPIDAYRVQKRGGTGIIAAKTHEDDEIEKIIISNTHADLLFFSNLGRVHRIRGHQVPIGQRQSKGIPANNFLNLEKNEKIVNLITVNDYNDKYLLFVTKQGLIKRTELSEFVSIRSNGKNAISLKEGDELFAIHITSGNDEIFIGSNKANLARFEENTFRPTGRNAQGVIGIRLNDNEYVIGTGVSSEGKFVLSIGEKGVGKLTNKDDYRLTKRGAKGTRTLKITEKTGDVVSVKLVDKDDQILLIANSGKLIRMNVSQINETGRSTSGVKLMDLDNKEKVLYVATFKLDQEDLIDEELEDNQQNVQ